MITLRPTGTFSANGSLSGGLEALKEDGERIGWEDSADWSKAGNREKAARSLAAVAGISYERALDLFVSLVKKAREAQEQLQNEGGEGEGLPAYESTPSGLVYWKPTPDGRFPVALTNFQARIVEEIVEDDGLELVRVFVIEAVVAGRRTRLSVGASQFASLNWVTAELGAGAIIHPGPSIRDHARVAIQTLSEGVAERRVYRYVGWGVVDGEEVYLHTDGAITARGARKDLEVRLDGGLTLYRLPEPPTDPQRQRAAIRASMGLLDVTGKAIAWSLLGTAYRAALGSTDFAIYLVGATGVGKTECAALVQQHWGAGMDSRHLPASWSSTANSLEVQAFTTKDAVLVVDDFAPGGGQSDVQRLHRDADRLIRAQGNASGRQRLRPDGTLRPTKHPRGMIVATGEDIPNGQSLRSRMHILEVSKGDVDWGALSAVQDDARNGLLAESMALYVQWLARQADWREAFDRDRTVARDAAVKSGEHKRTPGIVADLFIGVRRFLDFAMALGAIDQGEHKRLNKEAWNALGLAASTQGEIQAQSEPSSRFITLLRSAIARGDAHVAGMTGEEPNEDGNEPEAWGWTRHRVGGDMPRTEWRSHGDRIGWVDGDDLFIDGDAAYNTVQRMARDSERIAITLPTLKRRLHENGYLATVNNSGKWIRFDVRKSIQGARREVLHLRAGVFLGDERESD